MAKVTGDETLTQGDAVSVLDEIVEAQNDAYVIGLQLKLPVHEVKSIHSMYTHPRDRLLHVLIEFSKQIEPRPTWRAIVDALKSPSVDLTQLAERIEAAHCPVHVPTCTAVQMTSTVCQSQPQLTPTTADPSVLTNVVPPLQGSAADGSLSDMETSSQQISTEPPSQLLEQTDPTDANRHELPRQRSDDSAIGSEGRQSVTSPLSPQSSLSLVPFSTEMFSEKEVKERVDDFNIRFKRMVRDTQKALHKSKAHPKEIVSVLLLADAEFQNRYEKSGFFDSLLVAADVLDLFIELNKHWDHFNYYLLQQLIAEPGIDELVADNFKAMSHDLKSRMKHYAGEMAHFRRHTAVEIYCKAVIQPKQEVPEGFKQLIEERDLKTLQDVEEFRREVAYQYKLFECLVFWKNIVLGSVIITLWIPIDAKLVSVLPEVFSGEDDNEGSPVDPLPRSGDTQKNETHQVEQLPPDSELPHLGHSQKARDKTQPITKKASLASSVVTSVSKYVIDSYALLLAVKNGDKTEVERLIAKGADPNVHPIMIDFTPLMEASRTGNTQIAQLLIEKGADPNLTNNDSVTSSESASTATAGEATIQPLSTADVRGFVDVDIEGTPVDPFPVVSRTTVVFNFVSKMLTRPVKTFLHNYRKLENPLTVAVSNGNIMEVTKLIASGADPNPYMDWTPLKEASRKGHMDIALVLIQAGADPNLVTDDWTPLMEASRVGNKEMAEVLVKNGAHPNVVNSENWTALMAASNNGQHDVVDLLLQYGADPNRQDHVGWSALLAAVHKHHEDIALSLTKAGANPHLQNIECQSALRLAIDNGDQEEIVDTFLDRYSDGQHNPELNIADKYGETDLLFVCKKRNLKIIKQLLRKGANPNLANRDGESPLLIAIGRKDKDIVEELLKANADPDMETVLDLPLNLARSLKNEEIVELLKRYGAKKEKLSTSQSQFFRFPKFAW